MCLILFIKLLGPFKVHTTQERAETNEEPPKKVLCARCGHIEDTVFMQLHKMPTCCFIPCPSVPIDDTFPACSRCGMKIERIPQKACTKCKTSRTFESKYCPICGTQSIE